MQITQQNEENYDDKSVGIDMEEDLQLPKSVFDLQLIGVYLMGVHLIDVYFMDVYMFPNPKRLWGKPPDSPTLQMVVDLLRSEL